MTVRETKGKIRVLAVDDSAFVRQALIKIFNGHQEISIIDTAADGETAIALVHLHKPDVVTLDVRMPKMDGLSTLQQIMAQCPTPVIMLSSLTTSGGENSLKALEYGAVDFIDKSAAGGRMDFNSLGRELSQKILAAARIDLRKLQKKRPGERVGISSSVVDSKKKAGAGLVLIGASTGGPRALQLILGEIPSDFPSPILVVQHMPPGFTASFSERLDRTCPIRVKEAADGERLMPGTTYIAPAGRHLKVRKENFILHSYLDSAPESMPHRPSVDVLLESAAAACGRRCTAFILTGMGKDGAEGAKAIKGSGGSVFVESEVTSIVYGMPRAVAESVEVDGILPLHEIAGAMLNIGQEAKGP